MKVSSHGMVASITANLVDLMVVCGDIVSSSPLKYLLYVGLIYLKHLLLISIDRLRVFAGAVFLSSRPDSLMGTALGDCKMTYIGEEPVSGGYSSSVRRVYLDNGDVENPDSVIVKTSSSALRVRIFASGGYQREVNFYNQISHTLPIPIPKIYHSKWDKWRCSEIIIMENIAMGSSVVDKVRTSENPEAVAEEAVLFAARMHARYWGATPSTLANSSLGRYTWLKGYDCIQGKNEGMYKFSIFFISYLWGRLKAAMPEERGDITWNGIKWSRELVEFIDTLIDGSTWDACQAFWRTREHPLTLVHGDYHVGNQIWDEKTDKLYTIDWSEVAVGEGPADVAQSFLDFRQVSNDSNWENELIGTYWMELAEQGVDHLSYPLSMCREAYVRGGIDRGIQVLIGMVDKVTAFVAAHEAEYQRPYIISTPYLCQW
ncbi:hypothetical protein FOL47_005186 [Perkinsus chesapeaki]|uniref:Aminoglycoside phosphotransferase domain-containing protein n=1 Tax=Perkinsus chesapeaki TaxID=330153 RepID=A0A7J6MYT9_PERCH|nr:hypothetical protein FOL47_005186 [Perkinsus chesapeaki]